MRVGGEILARATFHLIFGLFALLGAGFLSAGPANAATSKLITSPAGSFNTAMPARTSIPSSGPDKPVCVHVTQRTHELCLACGTSFVMTIVSRVRAKAPGPRQKTDDFPFRDIPASFAAGREAAQPNTVYGSLSQASIVGTGIYARTNRLRI